VTEVIQLPRQPERGKPAKGWQTQACDAIGDAIEHARRRRYMALITGPSGMGKTTAARLAAEAFLEQEQDGAVFYAMMTEGTAGLQPGLQRIAHALRVPCPCHVGAAEVHNAIVDSYRSPKSVLIVDEAQVMCDALLNGVRNIWDELHMNGRDIGIVLIGTPDLADRINGAARQRARHLAPLRGRLGACIALDPVSDHDVGMICQHHGIGGAQAEKLILRVANGRGGLHNVRRLMEQAHELAGEGKPLTLGHLKDAVALVGVPA
jgi:type II secretory pathway predicted ATPase ExeA